MPATTAAYMRAYRARKAAQLAEEPEATLPKAPGDTLRQRIAELEAEVAHLKRLLAGKSWPAPRQVPLNDLLTPSERAFVEFRPVPKPSRSPSRTSGRGRAG